MQSRTRNIQVLAGLVFAAIVVIVVLVVLTGKKDKPGASAGPKATVAGVAETNKLLDGIPQSGYTLGNASAKIEIVEFMDLQCPYCQAHELDEQPTVIDGVVRPGIAKFRLLPLDFLGPDSSSARVVMTRLAAQNRAWQFVNLFYWNQGEENTGYVTQTFLTKIATAAGGSSADVQSTTPDAKGAKDLAEVDALAKQLMPGGDSTPTFAIGLSSQPVKDFKILDTTQSSTPAGQQIVAAVKALESKAGA